MQEIKTNPLGIRVTDAELRRLEAIKAKMGLPSMTNTTLGHDLLVMGMEIMEKRSTHVSGGHEAEPSKQRPPKRAARKQAKRRNGDV